MVPPPRLNPKPKEDIMFTSTHLVSILSANCPNGHAYIRVTARDSREAVHQAVMAYLGYDHKENYLLPPVQDQRDFLAGPWVLVTEDKVDYLFTHVKEVN